MRKWALILVLTAIATGSTARQVQRYQEKLSPGLVGKKPVDSTQEQVFWITATSNPAFRHYLRQLPAPFTILKEYPQTNLFVVRTSWQIMDSLLLPAPVTRLVDIPRRPKVEYALPVYDNSLNAVNAMHHQFPQINGDGLVVSVRENQFDTSDIDIRGRNLPTTLAAPVVDPHATTIATIIAGAGNSFYTGKGPARASLVSSSDFESLLPDSDEAYARYHISVQNHSYGTDIENYYGADAAAYDATVISCPYLMHVFSSGNSGNKSSTAGIYAGLGSFANLTGSFKMAKNILTVGAVDSFAIIEPLSSRGPAYDGRIKPELTAFGEEGTSAAAAIVSGIVLLMQQACKEMNNGTLPPAALVKAALVNSAGDAGTPGPDFTYGFGIVNGLEAIKTVIHGRYYTDSVSTGATKTFGITVPPNTRRLLLTLCWSDPPAPANAPYALVNDLDLALEHNSTHQTWYPWVLSAFPHADSLQKPAQRARDSLNNTEKITLLFPAPGNYSVHVNGFSVPAGVQSWFVAYEMDTAGRLAWNFPLASDHLLSNARNILRWNSSFADNISGILEYSTDRGSQWQLITNNLDLQKGFLPWQAPDTVCTALFRITVNGQEYLSDTCAIAYPTELRVGFHCADSLLLYWNTVRGVQEYQLWRLGNRYMEPVAILSDTIIVAGLQHNASHHYAVTPLIHGNKPGLQSHAVDYTLQGVGCYVAWFLADPVNGREINATLELGSLHQVKTITFEKYHNGSFVPVRTMDPDGSLVYRYTDEKPVKGANIYRAVVVLQHGMQIYTEPATVFFIDHSGYLVFPNPAPAGSMLQIHTNDLEPKQVTLYNMTGQKVLQQTINNLVTGISLNGLQRGSYLLVIWRNGQKDLSARLIIR